MNKVLGILSLPQRSNLALDTLSIKYTTPHILIRLGKQKLTIIILNFDWIWTTKTWDSCFLGNNTGYFCRLGYNLIVDLIHIIVSYIKLYKFAVRHDINHINFTRQVHGLLCPNFFGDNWTAKIASIFHKY